MSGFKRVRRSSLDDDRLTRLYEETSRDLLAFLLRRCPTAEDAADCLAETYRIAWERRGRMPAGAEARPWLFGVARNVASQQRRGDARRAVTSRELALAAERAGAVTASASEDTALAAALAELSPLDREIVTMLTWDGLAPREVAAVIGLSPNAVRIRSHRAMTRLRAALSASEPSAGVGDDDPDANAVTAAADRGG